MKLYCLQYWLWPCRLCNRQRNRFWFFRYKNRGNTKTDFESIWNLLAAGPYVHNVQFKFQVKTSGLHLAVFNTWKKRCHTTALQWNVHAKHQPSLLYALQASLGLSLRFLLQNQQSQIFPTYRTKGSGHRPKVWNGFYRKDQIVFISLTKRGQSLHGEKHELLRSSASSIACCFSKHED